MGGSLGLPASASAHSVVGLGSLVAQPIGSAAAVIGGSPWPGGRVARIRYFNGSEAKWPVAQAVKAWNSSGARVRFVPVPRRRAQIVISDMGSVRSDHAMAGFASLGYIYPGGGFVRLSRLAHPRRPNYSMAGVATHELGHVLGLNHEDDSCATMNTTLWASCKGTRACRLLEHDDVRGAVKLYGGRAKLARPSFCPKPPSRIRATVRPDAYGVTLDWRNPRGPFSKRVEVAREKGKCPTRPERGAGVGSPTGKPGGAGRLVDDYYASGAHLRTGRYCYALWGTGDPNLKSRRRTVWVEHNPTRPGAPTALKAVVGAAGEVSVSWAADAHGESAGFEGTAAPGVCPTGPQAGEHQFAGDAGTSTSLALQTPGRYCVAVWTRDSIGALFGPATVWVEYKGSAPEADFSYYADYLTATFYDETYDPDGDEIVARRWDFGDGTVNQGNDPNPSHPYAAPGTYTVHLTVTDSNGLKSTATHEVTVYEPSMEEYY